MTVGEQRLVTRGVIAGIIIGLAIGGIIAMFIVTKPQLFGPFIH